MAKRNQGVTMKLHTAFFNRTLEPERKRLSKKFGINMSQMRFTEYLAKSNAKITYPKFDNSSFFNTRKKRFTFSL